MATEYEELVKKAFPLQPPKIELSKTMEQSDDIHAAIQRLESMYDQLLNMMEQILASKPKVDNSELERETLENINNSLGESEPKKRGYPY